MALENPSRSLLWSLPAARQTMSHPEWQRFEYDACVHLGARCKAQAIESNVEEMAVVAGKCRHTHSPGEWRTPRSAGGSRFATSEEKEYTASLAYNIALALSWYALRRFNFPISVSRPLSICDTGSRVGWTEIDPAAMRARAMAATGVRLGLAPPEEVPGAWYPANAIRQFCAWRLSTSEFGRQQQAVPKRACLDQLDELQAKHLYIGRGSVQRDLPCSEWGNPFKVGQHGSRDEVLEKFERRLRKTPQIWRAVGSLAGRVLVCHCPLDKKCHADVLIRSFTEQYPLAASADVIFIGQGSASVRRERTKWASPFVPGTHGTYDQCLVKYIDWFAQQNELQGELAELQGKILLCECPRGSACHGDFLAAEVAAIDPALGSSAPFPPPPPTPPVGPGTERRPRGKRGRGGRPAALFAAVLPGVQGCIPDCVGVRWPQASFQKALWKLFPDEWLVGAKCPLVEDILCGEPFTIYPEFLEQHGLACWGPGEPCIISDYKRGGRRLAEGWQAGHFFKGEPPPQLIALQQAPEAHMRQAIELALSAPFPLDAGELAEPDLQSAACSIAAAVPRLADQRSEWYKPIQCLAARLWPLSQHLLQKQPPTVAAVAGRIHVAFIAAMVVLCAWPDATLPWRYITGFSQEGVLEKTGVLRAVPSTSFVPMEMLLAGAEDTIDKFEAARRRPEHDEFLLAECVKDSRRGVAGPLCTRAEMDARWGSGRWLPMPRFQITQASGKLRPIGDGRRYEHNEACSYSETLDCPTALQPVVHLRAFARAMADRWGEQWRDQIPGATMETGTEDMPDAYRFVPAAPEELRCNVVGVYDPVRRCHLYQEVYGHVFGRSAAVINFHRLQRLLTAVSRRWLQLLLSFYYDDASLQDVSSARGRGQRHLRGLFRLLHQPLAEAKQVNLTAEVDYLGLRHDVASCLSDGVVRFRPRPKIEEKILAEIGEREAEGSCTPAQASKLRGVLQFASLGMYGRVGAGGLRPLLQRQYADKPPWSLNQGLRNSFEFFKQLMQFPLRRECSLWASRSPPIVIASDGRLDDSGPASFAVLALDLRSGVRRAWIAELPLVLRQRWAAESNYIAQIEQAALVMLIIGEASFLAGRDAYWYIDNSSILAAMVKGAAGHEDVDAAAAAIHLTLAAQGARVWWEYIESKANWADEPSRMLDKSAFLKDENFETRWGDVPVWPWIERTGRASLVSRLCASGGSTAVGAQPPAR